MKILHTEASMGWGGQEIRILSEASGMLARGHQVHLLCAQGARIFEEAPRFGVPVTALPIGKKRLRGLWAMRHWLKQHPVDVINTHSSTDSWLAAVACATLSNPPALVRTRHISAPVPNNWTTRWLYQEASARVVTTGERLRETLIRENGLSPDRVISIPTGIDTALFKPCTAQERMDLRRQLALPTDQYVIGIVATLRSWKGHRYLLDALAQLPPEYSQNTQLVIVGEGPQRENLEKQITELNLARYVKMVGNQLNVADWLRCFDAFVLPSYANEGVPQALLQAMLTGLPCITTDVGSINEIARHNQTAWIVVKENVSVLVNALLELRANHHLAQQLGAQARNHCVERYSRERMLDQMLEVFEQVSKRS